VTTTEMMMNT